MSNGTSPETLKEMARFSAISFMKRGASAAPRSFGLVRWQRSFVAGLSLEFPLRCLSRPRRDWRGGLPVLRSSTAEGGGRGGRSYRNFFVTILVRLLRACLRNPTEIRSLRFGVPPLGGSGAVPPKGGTPNAIFQTRSESLPGKAGGLLNDQNNFQHHIDFA